MTQQNQHQQQDILGDILNDPDTGTIKGIDALNDLIHVCREDPKPFLSQPKKKAVSAKKKRKRRAPKKKTTHYLTEEVFDNIGDAKQIIQDILPDGSKNRATKSRIVESAVKVVLEEFERKGKDSYLVQELIKKKK